MSIDFKSADMKILLVDDLMENIKILISTLQPTGYQLAFCHSGEKVLDIVKTFMPDLILMDIVMPGIDGLETCRRLKLDIETSDIPVVFTTAKTDLEDVVEGFKVGGTDYVTKPFNSDELRARVQTQLMLRCTMSKLEASNKQLISDQDYLEELVKQRTASLESSNSMLESYSYSLAHDLRTPLRGIVSLSQLLADEASNKLNDDEKDLLSRIIQAGLHMSRLIEGTQNLFSITKDEMNIESVNLSQVSRAIMTSMQEAHPGRLIEVSINPDMIVHGDIRALKIVMGHLISNACKFTTKNEKTYIEVGRYRKDSEDICFIRDNGIGFDMQNAKNLFSSFTHIHSSAEHDGLGIGLAIAQRIIHRLGGKIWAEGKPDEGAVFYFSLPYL